MNREQMIAWLTLEGYTLYAACWRETGRRMGVWVAKNEEYEYQAFERKPPDKWSRYDREVDGRYGVEIATTDMPDNVIRALVKQIEADNEP